MPATPSHPPLIGRSDELARIESAHAAAEAGQSHTVLGTAPSLAAGSAATLSANARSTTLFGWHVDDDLMRQRREGSSFVFDTTIGQ